MKLGKLGVWYFFDAMSSTDAATTAQRIESLGYSILWIPEKPRSRLGYGRLSRMRSEKYPAGHGGRPQRSPSPSLSPVRGGSASMQPAVFQDAG